MGSFRIVLALLTVLAVTHTAMGEDRAVPRAPIGPSHPIAMELAPPSVSIPGDTIRIDSWADQKLNIYYWDGAAWQQVALGTEQTTDISCAKCAGTITVKYHDGTMVQQAVLKGASNYVMGWAPQKGAWMLTNPPRPTDR
jgi:hypothetical protein